MLFHVDLRIRIMVKGVCSHIIRTVIGIIHLYIEI